MLWLNKHQRALRLVILALLLIATLGPWGFDRIHVPAQYECSRPSIRLEDDFCGIPVSGMFAFAAGISGTLVRIMTGEALRTGLAIDLWSFFIILTLLPVFCAFLLLLLRENLRLQIFRGAVWGLAIAGGVGILLLRNVLMLGLPPIQQWGFWAYISLATVVMLLEIMVIVGRRRFGT